MQKEARSGLEQGMGAWLEDATSPCSWGACGAQSLSPWEEAAYEEPFFFKTPMTKDSRR